MRHLRRAPAAIVFLLLVLAISGCASAPPRSREDAPAGGPANAHVILVSFDGFRADYLDRYSLPGFNRVMRSGTRAKALIPIFPTKTFPNHYSIVTGLYAENHGIVANMFWDPARGESYSLADRKTVTDASWYRGEPIWVTAEKQGVKAACFFWPGSEAPIHGVRPSYWKTYQHDVPNEQRVDAVLEWLRLPPETRPRMITLYFSDVDSASHSHAPLAPETQAAVERVDGALQRLLDGIGTLPVRDEIYLVLVSDHGLTEISRDRVIALDGLIDTSNIRVGDAGPTANLHVPGGPAQAARLRSELNAKLRHGRAYLRSEIPERFHYRADPRIGDVVIVMEEHYMVSASARHSGGFPAGMHGWDPALPSMQGIFLVSGPGIRRGDTIDAVENIDIYPFMAELLGVRPAAHIDGRPGRIREALSQPATVPSRLTPVP